MIRNKTEQKFEIIINRFTHHHGLWWICSSSLSLFVLCEIEGEKETYQTLIIQFINFDDKLPIYNKTNITVINLFTKAELCVCVYLCLYAHARALERKSNCVGVIWLLFYHIAYKVYSFFFLLFLLLNVTNNQQRCCCLSERVACFRYENGTHLSNAVILLSSIVYGKRKRRFINLYRFAAYFYFR